MTEIIDKYVKYSIQQDEYTQQVDHRNNNKIVKKLLKIVDELKNKGQVEYLEDLLLHDNLNVRLWAASDLIDNNVLFEKCKNVLIEISRNDEGIIGLGAEMTLKRLGELPE